MHRSENSLVLRAVLYAQIVLHLCHRVNLYAQVANQVLRAIFMHLSQNSLVLVSFCRHRSENLCITLHGSNLYALVAKQLSSRSSLYALYSNTTMSLRLFESVCIFRKTA